MDEILIKAGGFLFMIALGFVLKRIGLFSLDDSGFLSKLVLKVTLPMAIIKNFQGLGDCDMRVWLCQIAKNTYYSYLKKNKRVSSIDEPDLQSISAADELIDTQISEQEEARQIRKILHDISEPYKEVFMWRVFGELSFKEIGDLYGKSDNWACITYHRARKMIQRRLEENEHEK